MRAPKFPATAAAYQSMLSAVIRDSLAARVVAPSTDVLHDFVGAAASPAAVR
ncbi:MAG: hypothetical protein M3143_05100 [Actinomycetota bacterium]|nr:hypothetical protein [Actinomycetota bacterium]